jgi:hypothetical protein
MLHLRRSDLGADTPPLFWLHSFHLYHSFTTEKVLFHGRDVGDVAREQPAKEKDYRDMDYQLQHSVADDISCF